MTGGLLVAGVGNVFLGDDGFGVVVTERLARESPPEHAHVRDFGIRGVHLAFELLNGYGSVVLVDALSRGDAPGTLYVIEPDFDSIEVNSSSVVDAHSMNPDSVLAAFKALGGSLERIIVVGCEPSDCQERMGLSTPVEAAVEPALETIRVLLNDSAFTGGAERQTTNP